MSNSRLRIVILFLVWIAPSSFLLFGEHIRGLVTDEIQLETKYGSEISTDMAMDEILILRLSENTRFLTGIQVEIVLSDLLKQYSDSFGVSIYRDLSPSPEKGMRAFTGRKIFFSILPFSNKAFIRIPMSSDPQSDIAMTPVVLGLSEVIKPSDFPICLTIQQVMKGAPGSILNRKFFVTFKEEIEKKGLLDLRIEKPVGFEDREITVFLDDQEIMLDGSPLELESGIHNLRIASEIFKPSTSTFALNPGQKSSLDIVLEPNISTLSIENLQGASVYLDGEKLEFNRNDRIQLTEGNHTIRFKLGEYSISKKFTVTKGKNYNIALLFDIMLKEE